MIFQAEPESAPVQAPVTAAPQSSANSELFFIVQQLQQDVRQLRGQLEEQSHLIQQLESRSKDRYKDLDSRVLDLSKRIAGFSGGSGDSSVPSSDSGATIGGVPGSVSPPVSTGSKPSASPASVEGNTTVAGTPVQVATETTAATTAAEPATTDSSLEQKREYQQAYALVKDKKFNEAAIAFRNFVKRYPDGDLTANAYYWLGEVYLVIPDLELAKDAFGVVIKAFPNHRKVPDALLKLGVTYERMQNKEKAKSYYAQVIKQYPQSTAAKLAQSYQSKL
jgi:tol-pal system protein YbgF